MELKPNAFESFSIKGDVLRFSFFNQSENPTVMNLLFKSIILSQFYLVCVFVCEYSSVKNRALTQIVKLSQRLIGDPQLNPDICRYGLDCYSG